MGKNPSKKKQSEPHVKKNPSCTCSHQILPCLLQLVCFHLYNNNTQSLFPFHIMFMFIKLPSWSFLPQFITLPSTSLKMSIVIVISLMLAFLVSSYLIIPFFNHSLAIKNYCLWLLPFSLCDPPCSQCFMSPQCKWGVLIPSLSLFLLLCFSIVWLADSL